MTELDLQALGIWWIPLPPPAERPGAPVNVWAIEDGAVGITLYGCGPGTPKAAAALSDGLAQAGVPLRDVGRVILPGALPDHAGGLDWIVQHAGRAVEVLASWPVRRQLELPSSTTRELRAGDRLEFRRFAATALRCGGHLPPLTGLLAARPGILFSSDHLLDDPGAYARLALASAPGHDPDAHRLSLARLAALPVSVVLPGRGAPFAGHRRVIREALARLSAPLPRARPADREPSPHTHPRGRPRGATPAAGTSASRSRNPPPQLQLHPRTGEVG